MSPQLFGAILSDLELHETPTQIEMKTLIKKHLGGQSCETKLELIEHLSISKSTSPQWVFRKTLIEEVIVEKKTSLNFLMRLSRTLNKSTVGMLDHEHIEKIRKIIREAYHKIK